jgi:branched-chain amino acid aminotransferase
MAKPQRIWLDGELVAYNEAKVHVATSAIHFGPTVFEGIRCYGFQDGRRNLFRLRAHVERLQASARAFHFEIPFTSSEIEQACVQTVTANGHLDAYVRPLAFVAGEALGFGRSGSPTVSCVMSFPWDNRHLVRSQSTGIRLHVSSVMRCEGHPVISKSKVSANYAAGLLAIHEARRAGFDDALLLEKGGAVAEASTSNVFVVWGDEVVTPPLHLPILAGITRDALLRLADESGISASERTFGVEEVKSADEVFIAGTTSEVTPVREIGGYWVGNNVPGKITLALSNALKNVVSGQGPDRGWTHWLEGSTRNALVVD